MVKPPACALILLAAGAATRMGRPKQLLAVQGQPLLRYLVEKNLTAPVTPIIVTRTGFIIEMVTPEK